MDYLKLQSKIQLIVDIMSDKIGGMSFRQMGKKYNKDKATIHKIYKQNKKYFDYKNK